MGVSKTFLLALMLLPSFKLGRSQVIRNGNCVVDREIWKLPDCALEERNGKQYVSNIYLPLFSFTEPHHLAWTNVNGEAWVYFNRQGRIVARNVAMFDNGPSPFHHGLVRIVSENKWGLARSDGAIVVPLQYDGMLEPSEHDQRWKACVGCHYVAEGEHGQFEGGNWFWLGRSGQNIGKVHDSPVSK